MKKVSIISMAIFWVSCTTMPVVKAYRHTGNDDQTQISGIDNKSKIQWRVANDSKKLYLTFSSDDKSVHRILMQNGFSLVLDTSGNKNEMYCFNVSGIPQEQMKNMLPQGTPGQGQGMNQSDASPDFNNGSMTEPKRFKRSNISGSFKEAIWKDGEDSESLIDLQFDKTDFAATFQIDSLDVMACNVIIPISSINTKGLDVINHLSIKIKIDSENKKLAKNIKSDNEGEDAGFSGNINGMGGGPGNGSMGGPGGIAMHGPGGSISGGIGGPNGGFPRSESQSSIEFWVSVKLAK